MKPTTTIEVLAQFGIQAKEGTKNIKCPLGIHEDKNPSFNLSNGLFHCHSCGESGDYIKLYSFMKKISNVEAFKELSPDYDPNNTNLELSKKQKSPERNDAMMQRFINLSQNKVSDEVFEYIQFDRGVDYKNVAPYIASDKKNVYVPLKNQKSEIVGIQSRRIDEKKFMIEKGSCTGVFWKNDNPSNKDLIIVEGMFDWLSVRQYTPDVLGFVSASAFIDVSSIVNKYETIYWLGDSDNAGEGLKNKFISQFKEKKILCTENRGKTDVNDILKDMPSGKAMSNLKNMCSINIGRKSFPRSTCINSYTWGGDFIDEKIWTPKKGDLVIICADENSGKSTFCNFVARRNKAKYDHNVCYFSLESTKEEVYQNTAFNYCGFGHLEWRDNDFKKDPRYLKKIEDLKNNESVNIIGRNVDKAMNIQEFFEIVKEQEHIDLLFVDNLTAFNTGESEASIKDVIQKLIWLAKEANIPIILVHHYRKRQPAEKQKFRDLHALSGSRVIKDLSPLIIQVARNRDAEDEEEKSEFYIKEGKVRKGIGTSNEIQIYFDRGDFKKNYNKFL